MATTEHSRRTAHPEGTIVYRPARPGDEEAVAAIDGSFTTDTVFDVTLTEEGFTIRPVRLDTPIHKVFPDDEPEGGTDEKDAHDERTIVAVDRDEVCGFVVTEYNSWNRRLTIADIEVAPTHRGRGVGRALMNHALEHARERGAGHVWLEVTHINAPAIRAYQRLGFAFCGLDTSLYEGTESAGETALYMSRPCS
ncbi:GNAT family N-acetyltransferase [Streptomyces sp. NPDC018045]|uniref:GNAT family N-acetyltransferase n=1 Tax=Streptomyces sp. NPDC018045 TaxID=3365037 RepID=UPI0037B10985